MFLRGEMTNVRVVLWCERRLDDGLHIYVYQAGQVLLLCVPYLQPAASSCCCVVVQLVHACFRPRFHAQLEAQTPS